MGKKAKLKQERKQQSSEDFKQNLQPTDFVKELQKQGYSLKKTQSCPAIPESKIEPQI